jgi:hypothetical protein
MNSKRKNVKKIAMKKKRMNENREDKRGGEESELFEVCE